MELVTATALMNSLLLLAMLLRQPPFGPWRAQHRGLAELSGTDYLALAITKVASSAVPPRSEVSALQPRVSWLNTKG